MEWNRDGSSLYTFLKAKDQRHPHQIIEFVDHEADKITTGRQKNLVYFVPKAPFVLELEKYQ